MEKPTINNFQTLGTLLIQRYERYIPNAFDESMSLVQKVNKVIMYLDQIGELTNDVVDQWNKVVEWLLEDGLTDAVETAFENLANNGEFVELVQTALDQLVSEMRNAVAYENILNLRDVYTQYLGVNCLDGSKISSILNAPENQHKTFTLLEGEYNLYTPIVIDSEISFDLPSGAVIKAQPYQTLPHMLWINSVGNDVRKIIGGGKWDGNGIAEKVIHVQYTTNTTLKEMQISNPVNYGLYVADGYELLIENILFFNTITDNNHEGNTALYLDTWDSVIRSLTVVNFNVGLDIRKNGNYFTDIHIWSNQISRLTSFTTGVIDRAGGNFYTNVYCDTCILGFVLYKTSFLKNCMFSYADNYKVAGVNPVYIIDRTTDLINDHLYLDNCVFIYNALNGSGNVGQVIDGSNNHPNVHFNGCYFQTPTSLSNKPTLNLNRHNVYKFKLTFTGLTQITAGNSVVVEKDLSTLFSFLDLKVDDTVIINGQSFGWAFQASYFVVNNKIQAQINNCSTTPQTPTNSTAYVTIIKNHDKTPIVYQ
jgi:hypothetical protein